MKLMQHRNTSLEKKVQIETLQGTESLDLLSSIQWQTQVRKEERSLTVCFDYILLKWNKIIIIIIIIIKSLFIKR